MSVFAPGNFQEFLLKVSKGFSRSFWGISWDNFPGIFRKILQEFVQYVCAIAGRTYEASLEEYLQKICKDLLTHLRIYFFKEPQDQFSKNACTPGEIFQKFLGRFSESIPEEFCWRISVKKVLLGYPEKRIGEHLQGFLENSFEIILELSSEEMPDQFLRKYMDFWRNHWSWNN